MKSQEVNFQKSQKLLASRAGSSKQTKASTALCNPPLKLNVLNRPPPQSLLGEQFLQFSKKITFRDLTAIFSFLARENLVFFRYSY